MRRLIALAAACAFAFAATPAGASSCSFVSATGPAFGAYDVFSATDDRSAGSVVINCKGNASAAITLSKGNSPTYAPRQMKSGTNVMTYNLYLDSGYSQIWGDTTGGSTEYGPAAEPNNTNVTVPVYGDIPALQDVPAGSYSDTIAVTVNF